jgi:hypothetical protein
MPPSLCFGDAREGTVGDLSSRACRGSTPLAMTQHPVRKHSWPLRSAATPPGSNIKLSAQTTHANPIRWKHPYFGLLTPLKRNLHGHPINLEEKQLCHNLVSLNQPVDLNV